MSANVKPVKRYEGLYTVSVDGKVFATSTGEEVQQNMAFNGTMYVQLAKNGTVHNKKVAYIVAKAFVKNPDEKVFKSVRHKDGNKQNNHASNLFWTRRCSKS
jgi:hypothetical protein